MADVSDEAEISNLHYPSSCIRPKLGTGRALADAAAKATGSYVDWPDLQQQAWEFLSMPYGDGQEALEFICPAWWNATGCECGCGHCSELYKACPIGFMLFRAVGLLCMGRENLNVRLHALVKDRWGRGLLDFGRFRLSFKEMLHSGWPYFGILTRVSEQLQLDGISETRGLEVARYIHGDNALDYATSHCASLELSEDQEFLNIARAVSQGIEGPPVPLERSMRAASAVSACPLQRAVAHSAVADFLLDSSGPGPASQSAELRAPFGQSQLPLQRSTTAGLAQVEDYVLQVESEVRKWANAGKPRSGRNYFFELLIVAWPVWPMMHRVNLKLLAALALDGCGGSTLPLPTALLGRGGGGGGGLGSSSSSSNSSSLLPNPLWSPETSAAQQPGELWTFCPACDCARQGEWAVEARYVTEYAEKLSQAWVVQAACEGLNSGAMASSPLLERNLFRRVVKNPVVNWRQRWLQLRPPYEHPGVLLDRDRATPSSSSSSGVRKAPKKEPVRKREAFITVLFAKGSAEDKVVLHVEAIRTLAFSAKLRCRQSRPFVVLTDGSLSKLNEAALKADGIVVVKMESEEMQRAYGAYDASQLDTEIKSGRPSMQLQSWWLERGIAPTAIKLAIWNMTEYDQLVFLDADTLILDSVDELFEMTTFASGLNPYSTHGLAEMAGEKMVRTKQPGINTGVMVVQPNAEVAARMAEDMESGIHDNSPIAQHLGQSDQPWLDAFWLQYSRRLGLARFVPQSSSRATARRRRRSRQRKQQRRQDHGGEAEGEGESDSEEKEEEEAEEEEEPAAERFLGCDLSFRVHWGETATEVAKKPKRPRSPWPTALRGFGPEKLGTWAQQRQCPRLWRHERGGGWHSQEQDAKDERAKKRQHSQILRPHNARQAHCVLPVEYDFFVDFKGTRTHVWYETLERHRMMEVQAESGHEEEGGELSANNISDVEFAARRYTEVYGVLGRGVKILHWPGEMRKPWQRWHRAVRSVWDEAWWDIYHAMCKASTAPCRLRCDMTAAGA